jgi:ankyrin repeat protein
MGNLQIIDFLLKALNSESDVKSKKGRTPLSKACFLAKPDVVRYLLENIPNIDLNSTDDKGRTPLHNASWGPEGGINYHSLL